MPSAAGSSRSGVDLAVADHPHRRRGRGGQLVEAVVPPEDQRPSTARGQHPGHAPAPCGGRRSRSPRPPAGPGWSAGPRKLKTVGMPISRRGPPAKPHAGVEHRREEEADAGLLDAAGDRRRPAGRWRRPAPRGRRRHPRTTTRPGRRAWRRAPPPPRRRRPPSRRCSPCGRRRRRCRRCRRRRAGGPPASPGRASPPPGRRPPRRTPPWRAARPRRRPPAPASPRRS